MYIKYSDYNSCIDKLRVFIASKAVDGASVIMHVNAAAGTMMLSYTDGHKAISMRREVVLSGEEMDGRLEFAGEGIILPYKNLVEISGICKPVGVLSVDDISIELDGERKSLVVRAEKYIEQESEDVEGYERRVISRIKQSFTFTKVSDDRRKAILARVDYNEMLRCYDEHKPSAIPMEGVAVGDIWEKSELLRVLSAVADEPKNYTIFSGKTHSIAVSNVNYAVYEARDEVQSSMCISNDVGKNIVDVFNKSDGDELLLYTDGTFCTACDNAHTAVWFEAKKPMKMALTVIAGYTGMEYRTFRIVALRDALTNVVKCCRQATDKTVTKLKFYGNDHESMNLAFDGLNSTSKENNFSLELEEVQGDIMKLCNMSYEISFEQLEKMLDICCGSTFIGLYVNDASLEQADGGATQANAQPVLNIVELYEEGGQILEGRKAYTMMKGDGGTHEQIG